MTRIRIIDGNNYFGRLMEKATGFDDLVASAKAGNYGFNKVYWIFDGFDSRHHRRAIYPEYKIHRNKKTRDPGYYQTLDDLKTTGMQIIGGVYQIEIPLWEADDVIKTIVAMEIARNPDVEIHVTTTDVDLTWLMSLGKVVLPNAKLPKNVAKPEDIRIYKTLVGDSSDNVKGLVGFGEKAWENLTEFDKHRIMDGLISGKAPVYLEDVKLHQKVLAQWTMLQVCWKVIGLMDVPDELFNSATVKYHPALTF